MERVLPSGGDRFAQLHMLADAAGTEPVPTPEEAAARRIAALESLLRERNPPSVISHPPSADEAAPGRDA